MIKLSLAQHRVMRIAKSNRDLERRHPKPQPVRLRAKRDGMGHGTKATLDALVVMGYLTYIGYIGANEYESYHTYEVTQAGWDYVDDEGSV